MKRCPDPPSCGFRHCVVCVGHLHDEDRQTCVECLGQVRRDLADILNLFALLPDQLEHRAGQTALSLLAPGSVGAFWRDREDGSRLDRTPWRPPQRLRHEPLMWSSDPAEQAEQAAEVGWVSGSANPNQASDPPSVAYELGQWEDDWRSLRGEPAATEEGTVMGAVGYLSRRAGWAADHHPAFDDFAREVAGLRSRLEVVTSMDSRPLVSAEVSCLPCERENGAVVKLRRQWTDDGLADEWMCPRCRTACTPREFWVALHAALEDKRRAREQEGAS